MGSRFFKFVRAWPLTTYVASAAGLFFLTSAFFPYGREPIVIDARTIAGELELRADERGRDLSADERAEAIRRFVDEEILIREARRRGLHLTTSRVRERLLRRMRAALSQGIPQPSRAQLRAYYNTNASRYQVGEAISFEHVFYSDSATAPTAAQVRSLLDGTGDPRGMGERYWLGNVVAQVPRDRLAAAFGPTFARDVLNLAINTWSGPLTSNRGVHYVRVLERAEPTIPDFELVEAAVRLDWMTEKRNELMGRRLDRMRARYVVTLPS